MRSERWTAPDKIKRHFCVADDPTVGAGPVLYCEKGVKYTDDSEAHIAVIGRTGVGKSQCGSLPFMREVLRKNESLLMIDPKGEGYRRNGCYIPSHYQKFILDFRSPYHSPSGWNPLSAAYRLFREKSSDPSSKDAAASMVSEFWEAVYPVDANSDPFWNESAANYAKGLTYGLFEQASDEEQVNLDSISVMMDESEIRAGMYTQLKMFYDALPTDSLAKKALAGYVSGPNDTRGSTHAVAAKGLEIFSRSKGLMEMLRGGRDALNVLDIDVRRPFAIIIITPDETNVYDALAGILVSQIAQHLVCVAQEMGGRLPIRVNIILEELGSIKSIVSLPTLMVTGRSRNIRLMLVLQSGSSQLEDIYGKSKAEIINSCIGITIGFSTNSWDTLNDWSRRCGERQISGSGGRTEPLVTSSSLFAMPMGTALVLKEQYKFVTHLPLFDEMYDNSDWRPPKESNAGAKRRGKAKVLDLKTATEAMRSHKKNESFAAPPSPVSGAADLRKLFDLVDSQIIELSSENKSEGKKPPEYHVTILSDGGRKPAIARIISSTTGMKISSAAAKLSEFPVRFTFDTKTEAEKFADGVNRAGGMAIADAA